MAAYAVIAGIGIGDMRPLLPGFVCDMYVQKRAYDDEQHGIQRERDDHDADAEDFEEIEEG